MKKNYILNVLILFVFTMATFANTNFLTPSVTTDLDDYAPGSTAYITGTGFQPGEEVELHVHHADGDPLGTDPQYHEPWTVTADANGGFSTSWYVPTEAEGDASGATLLLEAHGNMGSEASWTFTDSGSFDYNTTSGKSNIVSLAPGNSDNTTISVDVNAPKNNGNFNVSLSIVNTGSPSITIGSGTTQINLTSLTIPYANTTSNSGVTHVFPITVAVGSSVADGSYTFQVTAIESAGSISDGSKWSFTVVVGSTGGSIGTVSIGSQTGTSTYGTASSPTFAVTSTRGSNGTVNGTYSVSGLPAGVTSGGFSLIGTWPSNGGDPFPSATLTLNVDASVDAGSFNFDVFLTDGGSQASAVGTLVVGKADQTITWANPSDIVYGTALSATQLNATVSVPGVEAHGGLTYTPASGVKLDAGNAQDLKVDVVGSSNYNPATKTVQINVLKAGLTITANNASKYCGQPNPTFSVRYDGFVSGENESVLGGSLAFIPNNENSPAGSYDLIPSGLTSSNYDIGFVKGTFTILSVIIDASANSTPVQIGSNVILIATILPNVANVSVTFYLNGALVGSSNTNLSGVATLNIGTLETNVYLVKAIAGFGCSESNDVFLPIYDPNGGFVTGGGWINSPNGALIGTTVTGKANFGFVAKYKTGKNNTNEVDGNTNFQFKEGDFHFKSTSHDDMSLVISGEKKATYRGVGTVNGYGNHKFMVTVIDGDASGGDGIDRFRIRVLANNSSSAVIYDNEYSLAENAEASTAIGGGSIVIHKPKGSVKNSARGTNEESTSVTVTETIVKGEIEGALIEEALIGGGLIEGLEIASWPNPSNNSFKLKLKSNNNIDKVEIQIFDLNGRQVYYHLGNANQEYRFGDSFGSGLYFVNVIQGKELLQTKLIKH